MHNIELEVTEGTMALKNAGKTWKVFRVNHEFVDAFETIEFGEEMSRNFKAIYDVERELRKKYMEDMGTSNYLAYLITAYSYIMYTKNAYTKKNDPSIEDNISWYYMDVLKNTCRRIMRLHLGWFDETYDANPFADYSRNYAMQLYELIEESAHHVGIITGLGLDFLLELKRVHDIKEAEEAAQKELENKGELIK